MHVAINALAINNRSGTGRYCWGLIHGLINPRHPQVRFTVFVPSDFTIPSMWADEENIRFFSVPIRSVWRRIVWEQCSLPRILSDIRADVLHSPAFVAPVLYPAPVVHLVTVHDLVYRRYPHTVPFLRRMYYQWAIPRSMKIAHTVFADSVAVMREIHELPDAPKRAIPLPLGVCPLSYHPHERPEDYETLARYHVAKPYGLFVGTQEPRKNLGVVLQAFNRAREQGVGISLVLCGRMGWMQEEKAIPSPGIQAIGYVPEEHLPALYRHARFLIAPSIYEGFDLPVLEACACGTPIVASDIPVHREVLGEYARYVATEDVAAWVEALAGAEQSPPPRYSLPVRTWSEMADEVNVVYQSLEWEGEGEEQG